MNQDLLHAKLNKRSMQLDWKIRLLDRLLRLNQPVHLMTPEELQLLDETAIPPLIEAVFAGRKLPIPEVIEFAVQGRYGTVPVRLYHLWIMGDSAGGNLAAALCLVQRDRGEFPVLGQILLYPVLDGFLDQPSIERYADAPVLTKEAMQKFVDSYARSEDDLKQPYFSPLRSNNLAGLPPALIVTAEYDVLHDQAQLYAQKLQQAGTPVQLIDYPGMIHGFLSFPPFCQSALPAFEEVAAFVQRLR